MTERVKRKRRVRDDRASKGTYKDEVGARLKAVREARELTPDAVAKAAEIAPNMVWRYENGHALPTLPTLLRLNRVLQASFDFLLYGRGQAEWKSPPPF